MRVDLESLPPGGKLFYPGLVTPERGGNPMAVEKFKITARSPYRDAERYGSTGAYERIDAVVTYAVDPTHEVNAVVVDLDKAPQAEDGLVRFEGDVVLLRPTDPKAGCRTALVELPNRGRRTSLSHYNRAPPVVTPSHEIDPGDGFLFRRGWTLAWCGWQWDVPRSAARMGLNAPSALTSTGELETAQIQLRLQLHERTHSVDLTDHHVGLLGGHEPLPSADPPDNDARLLRRSGLWDEPVEINRKSWRFARAVDGQPITDPAHVWLDGGFEPGVIYDLIYQTAPCRIAGVGLLAARDFGTFLRSDAAANPLTKELDHLILTGQSQCGRLLRTSLYFGCNLGEDGAPAYDGVLSHVAGARRGEFNHRVAQPSVQPTPGFGHLFPFADEQQTDSQTGQTAGLLDRQRQLGAMPKVFYTNTSSEYWRGDASLAHTNASHCTDIDPPDDTRHYLLSSTQHGPGMLPFTSTSVFGSQGGNRFNTIDYTPLMRAALINLQAWIVDDVEPPPNAIPRSADGTGVSRATVLEKMTDITGMKQPETEGLSTIRPLDLGPQAVQGIGRYPATPVGEPYPCLVSAIDDNGNEVAGIRMPDIEVPVATHTGWNPRHPRTGAADQILEYIGSTVPFPATSNGTDDRRPGLQERYSSRTDYLDAIRAVAQRLVTTRHLVEEDIETCVTIAADRYDATLKTTTSLKPR